MNSKKGISLIVLVITIIVIIILAAAVVMSLSNNNVLTNSRTAVNESDFSEVQSSFQIKMQSVLVTQLDSVVISGDITKTGFAYSGYAGVEPTAVPTATTISDSTNTLITGIKTSDLDLPNTFSHVAIANNKVVAIVKNGQLIVKGSDGALKVQNANYGSDTGLTKELWDTYSSSTAITYGYPRLTEPTN